MDITKVVVRKYNQPKNNLKGFATVTLDDELVLTGIKIVKGNKGLFLGMPSSYWESDEQYHDIYFPVTAEFREELTEQVLEAYEEADDEEDKKKKKTSKKKTSKKTKKDYDEDEEDE